MNKLPASGCVILLNLSVFFKLKTVSALQKVKESNPINLMQHLFMHYS